MSNPLHSALHEHLEQYARAIFARLHLQHMLPRLYYACLCMPVLGGGQVLLQFGSGALPGDSVAGPWFLAPYHEAWDEHIQRTQQLVVRGTCSWLAPILRMPEEQQQTIDLGINTYVDDGSHTYRITDPLDFHIKSHHNMLSLECSCHPRNFHANESKRTSVPGFVGKGSQPHNRAVFRVPGLANGTIQTAERYLGPWLAFNGSLCTERTNRATATKVAYYSLGKAWSKITNTKWLSILFKGFVLNTATSGWTALAPTKADTDCLDKVTAALARKALQCKAHTVTVTEAGEKHVALSNSAALRKISVAPVAEELQEPRSKWWQQIV